MVCTMYTMDCTHPNYELQTKGCDSSQAYALYTGAGLMTPEWMQRPYPLQGTVLDASAYSAPVHSVHPSPDPHSSPLDTSLTAEASTSISSCPLFRLGTSSQSGAASGPFPPHLHHMGRRAAHAAQVNTRVSAPGVSSLVPSWSPCPQPEKPEEEADRRLKPILSMGRQRNAQQQQQLPLHMSLSLSSVNGRSGPQDSLGFRSSLQSQEQATHSLRSQPLHHAGQLGLTLQDNTLSLPAVSSGLSLPAISSGLSRQAVHNTSVNNRHVPIDKYPQRQVLRASEPVLQTGTSLQAASEPLQSMQSMQPMQSMQAMQAPGPIQVTPRPPTVGQAAKYQQPAEAPWGRRPAANNAAAGTSFATALQSTLAHMAPPSSLRTVFAAGEQVSPGIPAPASKDAEQQEQQRPQQWQRQSSMASGQYPAGRAGANDSCNEPHFELDFEFEAEAKRQQQLTDGFLRVALPKAPPPRQVEGRQPAGAQKVDTLIVHESASAIQCDEDEEEMEDPDKDKGPWEASEELVKWLADNVLLMKGKGRLT